MTVASTPKFSVIIPTYNRAGLLARTLGSVFRQRLTNYEVVVVDDGSTDRTGEVLASFADRVRACRQPNRGPGASRNAGAERARGEYLAFLDSDDLWFPWSLETFQTLIDRYQQPALLCGNFLQFETDAELDGIQEEPARGDYFVDYLASWQRHRVTGAGMVVVRRDVFLGAGGFTAASCNLEDHDLALRLGVAPGFVQVSNLTLGWRRHPGGITNEMGKSLAGGWRLIRTEQSGGYPGGYARARARLEIITQHIRSVSLEFVKAGMFADAWALYRSTLRWQVALGRLKYLMIFPPYLTLTAARFRWRGESRDTAR